MDIIEYAKPLLETAISALAGKHGGVIQVLAWISAARLIFKPLFTFLGDAVKATPTVKDDELLGKVMESKVYKIVSFALDYLGSIKLPQK